MEAAVLLAGQCNENIAGTHLKLLLFDPPVYRPLGDVAYFIGRLMDVSRQVLAVVDRLGKNCPP